MNALVQTFFSIPVTHTLLIVAATTCLTIFATISQHMTILLILYALSLACALYKNHSQLLLITTCALLFSLFAIIRISQLNQAYNSHQTFLNTRVSIQGTITQINDATLTKEQTTILLKTDLIYKKNNAKTVHKVIAIFCPTQNVKNLQENQVIKIDNIVLQQPKIGTDYQCYLLKEGIWATAHCNKNVITVIQSNHLSLIQYLKKLITQPLNGISSTLFYPLFLGQKEKSSNGIIIQHQSIYWGIAHHMARSGAHLAILFGLLMLLLHYIQFRYVYRYLISIALLLGYAIISQLSISFVRALIMILLHISCKLFKSIPSSLHIITLTILITLLHNPMQLFFLDFQLSFGITYIIIWLFNLKRAQTIAFDKRYLVRS